MKKLILFFTLLIFISCDNQEALLAADNIDTAVEFSIVNSSSEDLLDPANPNGMDVRNIKVFYLISGEKKEVYNGNLLNPRNFRIYKHEKEYRIGINLNESQTAVKPVTYVQWNTNDTDTLEVTYTRKNGSILKNTVWLNGVQIWERGDNTVDAYQVLLKEF